MQIFGSEMPSSATSATLLPPLLPPLNVLYHSALYVLVAVVAVKFTKYIV